jgi:hypothetical protein
MHLELIARLVMKAWFDVDACNVRVDVHDEDCAVVA